MSIRKDLDNCNCPGLTRGSAHMEVMYSLTTVPQQEHYSSMILFQSPHYLKYKGMRTGAVSLLRIRTCRIFQSIIQRRYYKNVTNRNTVG